MLIPLCDLCALCGQFLFVCGSVALPCTPSTSRSFARICCGLMLALTLALSHRMGEGMAIVRHRLKVRFPTNAVARFSPRRRIVLSLPCPPQARRRRMEEKGRGEVEPLLRAPSPLSFCARLRLAAPCLLRLFAANQLKFLSMNHLHAKLGLSPATPIVPNCA